MKNQVQINEILKNEHQNNLHQITIPQLNSVQVLDKINELQFASPLMINQANFKMLILKVKSLEEQLIICKQRQIKLQQNNRQLTDMLISANQYSVKKNTQFVNKVQTMIQKFIEQPKTSIRSNFVSGDLNKHKQNNSTFNQFKTQGSKQISSFKFYNYKQNIDNGNKGSSFSPIRAKTKTQTNKNQFKDISKQKVNKNEFYCRDKRQMSQNQQLVFKRDKNNAKAQQYRANLSKNIQIYQKLQKKIMRV